MSIQQSLNQALGIGAVLATQTGAYAAQKEKALKKQEESTLQRQIKTLGSGFESTYDVNGKPKNVISQEVAKERDKQVQALRQRLFELNPTQEHAEQWLYNMPLGELAERQARADNANMKAKAKVGFKIMQKEMIKNGNK